MADIHILETDRSGPSVRARIVYHVPVNRDNNAYPGGQTSGVPNISQAEIDALAAGTLYEESKTLKTTAAGTTPAALAATVRARWEPARVRVQAMLDERFKYYGTELARA